MLCKIKFTLSSTSSKTEKKYLTSVRMQNLINVVPFFWILILEARGQIPI